MVRIFNEVIDVFMKYDDRVENFNLEVSFCEVFVGFMKKKMYLLIWLFKNKYMFYKWMIVNLMWRFICC